MANVELTKQERKRLISKISYASGIAQYALIEKMTDEQVLAAVEHLEILQLVKDANHYNRYCQGQKTQAANEKLREFLDPQRSELVQAGKWLVNALSKTGRDRKQALLEKELVHKDDYNDTVSDMRGTIEEIQDSSEKMATGAELTIEDLEQRINTLRHQLSQVQAYISMNQGADKWRVIQDTFNIQ